MSERKLSELMRDVRANGGVAPDHWLARAEALEAEIEKLAKEARWRLPAAVVHAGPGPYPFEEGWWGKYGNNHASECHIHHCQGCTRQDMCDCGGDHVIDDVSDCVPDCGGCARQGAEGERDEAKAALATEKQAHEETRRLALRLVTQMELVHESPEYQRVWGRSQDRLGPYKGPTYEEEFKRLAAYLFAPGARLFSNAEFDSSTLKMLQERPESRAVYFEEWDRLHPSSKPGDNHE